MSMTGKGRRIHCVMRIASLFRRAMSAGVLVLVTLGVDAGEVPSAPMHRIETGHHTSFIQSLAYDESRQRHITESDDKTIRVRQMPAHEAVAIYLFDVESGAITGRITGFDEVVGPLAYSPDGNYLALVLLGRQGLLVLQTGYYSEIAWDIDYQYKTIGLLYTPQGGIITTSLDGYVRLYDKDFRLIGRVQG